MDTGLYLSDALDTVVYPSDTTLYLYLSDIMDSVTVVCPSVVMDTVLYMRDIPWIPSYSRVIPRIPYLAYQSDTMGLTLVYPSYITFHTFLEIPFQDTVRVYTSLLFRHIIYALSIANVDARVKVCAKHNPHEHQQFGVPS